MAPRLVATDLDGTLLRSDGSLSRRTRAALHAADEAGVIVVFVTARPLRWMDSLWPHVGSHGKAIVSNGAAVFDVGTRRVEEIEGIDRAAGLRLTDTIRGEVPGTVFGLERVSGIALEPGFNDPERVPAGSPIGPLADIWSEPALKVMARHPEMAAAEFRERVIPACADLATPTWSVDFLIEISARGVTKGGALARLCDRLGIAAAEVIACGDMPNDLPMLSWAGTSVAVANAHADVLAAADLVTDGNDQDGVARVIEGLL